MREGGHRPPTGLQLGAEAADVVDMTTAQIAVLAGIVVLGVWLVLAYNGLVAARNRAAESWSGVDVQLKRRHDLVPNLVETVAGYADHERATLDQVVTARAQAQAAATDPADRAEAERRLSTGLAAVNALAEQYPDLKAAAPFQQLQAQLAEIEDEIQAARRIYNADVRLYLTRKQSFPTMLMTGLGDFPDRLYFELDGAADRAVPQVSFPRAA